MKRKFKRIASLVLAAVMVFAMAVPGMTAVAAGEKGTLTINNAVPEKTYDLYKIFSLERSGEEGSYNYHYEFVEPFNTFFSTKITPPCDTVQKAIKYLSQWEDNAEGLSKFARDIFEFAVENNVDPAREVTIPKEGPTNYAVTDLEGGYYLMNPRGGASPNGEYATMFSLGNVANGATDETIIMKAVYPTLDKTETDDNEEDPDKLDEVSIGKIVTFHLKTTVPETAGYERFWFVINDTLSKGLDYVGNVKITIGTNSLKEKQGEEVGQFTATPTKNGDGTTSLEIVFLDFLKLVEDTLKVAPGTEITVDYEAKLNKDAVINGANDNTATLTYSNKPGEDYTGDAPGPDDKDIVGTTPESKTETYTTALRIKKTDDNGNILTGAAFTLSGDMLQDVVMTSGEYFKRDDTEGTFWKLTDGSYTDVDPADLDGDSTALSRYVSTTEKYKKVTDTGTLVEGTGEVKNKKVELFVGEDGFVTFNGLGIGEYTIEETVVPPGYNRAKDMKLNVTFDTETKTFKATLDGTEITLNGDVNAFETTVVNQNGTQLPETGGIGTTIFYVVGSVLVLAAVILLVTKRRMKG